jgi:hypothetical protein
METTLLWGVVGLVAVVAIYFVWGRKSKTAPDKFD